MTLPSQDNRSLVEPEPQLPASDSAIVPIFLSLLVLVGIAFGGWTWWRVRQAEALRGQAIVPTKIGPALTEFELTERSGKPLRSADLKGRVWVATYFFTTCPGNCLHVNRNIQRLHKLPELNDVTWVSITCDPDTDDVETLRKYAEQWEADSERWLFGRADLEYTQQIAKGMNVFLARKGHQDRAIVFDKAGKIRGMFDAMSTSDCERMRAMLVKLQAEDPPQELAAGGRGEEKSI